MKVAIAQINVKVGDLHGNTERIIETIKNHREAVDLIVFPELAICGYPPEDLLFHRQFIHDCYHAVQTIADHCKDVAVVLGYPRFHAHEPDKLHNSAVLIQNEHIKMVYDKHKLPNYLVFDEMRYFTAGGHDGLVDISLAGQSIKVGITICEDIWYDAEPVVNQASLGADLLINISASPYAAGKIDRRIDMLKRRAESFETPLIYCNLVGGQDELIFDGSSVAIDRHGDVMCRLESFKNQVQIIDLNDETKVETTDNNTLSNEAELYQSLVMCTRDYFVKNGFSKAVLGLSGGIDSALSAVICCDAIGAQNVTGLLMPSKFSSDHSVADAKALANNMGMPHHVVPIEPMHQVFESNLSPLFDDYFQNLTDENLQARIRGVLNMAVANNQNAILLCTGNKSETAVGYTTLYGDMAGGFAPIKDLFKMQVYALCQYRNTLASDDKPAIPHNTIEKPPSAELRPDQKDSDSLPDYAELDQILEAYIHNHQDAEQIAALGFDLSLVKRILRLVDINEYKRQQAAPGPRVTQMGFGKDRRMPITNGYNH
ncbi:NAD+ synthase [Marinicella rhabdoformis]|uniref:NAD+ synthase n=1 Tax=Marinicella rhabdoformis TaxID=2580566 RepID=UPI0012AEC516|nr:NAD+ synthase [Marinicella rhabdoformis]